MFSPNKYLALNIYRNLIEFPTIKKIILNSSVIEYDFVRNFSLGVHLWIRCDYLFDTLIFDCMVHFSSDKLFKEFVTLFHSLAIIFN